MSLQKFPLATVSKIRQYIQNTLALTDTEQQLQVWTGLDDLEPPEPTSLDDLSGLFQFGGLDPEEITIPIGHWQISTVNPADALLKLPGLWLRPEFRLVSFLYRDAEAGKGAVFAVPQDYSTTAWLEKAMSKSRDITQPPQPEGAIASFMEAVDGDGSAASFLLASLLRRELEEFGALGQHRDWSHHRIIDAIPPQAKWRWQGNPPKDLAPKARLLPDGQAATEFFTCRLKSPVAIFRHLDQYPLRQYKSSNLDKPIAAAYR
ncbi:hypothetical protein IFO70_03365 [Phormidium tenue FACHB-886]|nr:hypothetical protein [Phormidium tenue FACHB-886]